jgi:ATP-dependent DNA helicase RecG
MPGDVTCVHASRNPRIVRVLTDLGYMREQGEGVPRMFEAMDREGLYPPELRIEADTIFTVVLRNTPVYSLETGRWLQQFEPLGLSGNQKRLLAYAKEHDSAFTSHAYQRLAGVNIYEASRDIKDLMRKGLARIRKKGGRAYEITEPSAERIIPGAFAPIYQRLQIQGHLTNEDLRELLGADRHKAYHQIRQWVDLGLLEQRGKGRATHYVAGPALNRNAHP